MLKLLFTVVCLYFFYGSLSSSDKGQILSYNKRNATCYNAGSIVCAMRIFNGIKEYKQFENDCFLSLSNIFDFRYNVFWLVTEAPCMEYLSSRRDADFFNMRVYDENHKLMKLKKFKMVLKTTPKVNILRDGKEEVKIKKVWDGHRCPPNCLNIYQPVCLNVNKNNGSYFKMYHFINHCQADLYYCSHPEIFDGVLKHRIEMGSLLKTLCADNIRFLDHARFYDLVNSLGYYGWMLNDTAGNGAILHDKFN